jgi:phosphate transport system substrate-binding protein
LRLPSGVIARAATGTAERWDSLEMKAANPGLPLPALPVRWMPPPEASGAAHAARTSAASVLGATPAADYPRADTKDLQALAAATSSTPGALALLPQDVARISDLHESSVSMLSADGRWVQADAVAVRAALSGTELREKASTGEWALVLNVQRGAWPLLAAQYALVARVQRNGVIAAGALQFIWYSLLRGDPALLDLGRTPLRDALQVAVLRALEKVVDTEGKRVRYKLVGI